MVRAHKNLIFALLSNFLVLSYCWTGPTFQRSVALKNVRAKSNLLSIPLVHHPIEFRMSVKNRNDPDHAIKFGNKLPNRTLFWGSISLLSASLLFIAPANVVAAAASAATAEKMHIGQKVASYLRSTGRLPDWATIMLISSMPIVELRGGVPVGLWMGLPIAKVFALCVIGNMIPIPLILWALQSKFVQDIGRPLLNRARQKAAGFGDVEQQLTALLVFVGIPLPGTGAWTGAMIASVLGMPFTKSIAAICGGVVSAGAIMTALTLAGKAGAIVVSAVLLVFGLSSLRRTNEEGRH